MEKRVALITGAAHGIGWAMVNRFYNEGYAVGLVDLPQTNMNSKVAEYGYTEDHILLIEGDLQEVDFLQEIVNRCMQKWGRIDVVVNNAAWRTTDSLRTSSLEVWNKTLAINVTAPAFLAKMVAEALIKQKKSCVFINMSSIMSELVAGYASAYVVCKGAMESLTKELAVLYGRHGFRAVAIRPGNVKTSLSSDYTDAGGNNVSAKLVEEIEDRTPEGRSASANEIAAVAIWLASSDASFITGTAITVDGGLSSNFSSYASKRRLKSNEF